MIDSIKTEMCLPEVDQLYFGCSWWIAENKRKKYYKSWNWIFLMGSWLHSKSVYLGKNLLNLFQAIIFFISSNQQNKWKIKIFQILSIFYFFR